MFFKHLLIRYSMSNSLYFHKAISLWKNKGPGGLETSNHEAFASLMGMAFVQTLGSIYGTPKGGHKIKELTLIKQTTSLAPA